MATMIVLHVTSEAILDTALELGEERGWDAVHLHDVAGRMGVSLAAIARHYPHKDSLSEAWFDRADAALLRVGETEGWTSLSERERLQHAMLAWLDALEPHRRLTRQMLLYKLQPEHVHLQLQGMVRISSTVQWIREVALLRTVSWRREIEEAALTSIYIATFMRWLTDETPGALRTRQLLERLLRAAERAALRLPLPR